jgi:hypothetical protein
VRGAEEKFKTLRAKSVEALSIIALSVGYEKFQVDANFVLPICISILGTLITILFFLYNVI